MSNQTVTIYRETHESACMDVPAANDAEIAENQQAYDDNESAYFAYVRKELTEEGFNLEIDPGSFAGRSYSVDADTLQAEDRAHSLMSGGGLKGFWEWYN